MMLSRVADSIYWTARYLERAANTVRFLDVSHMLDLDQLAGEQSPWEPLVWITGDMELFRSRYGEATRENVIRFLVLDTGYSNSVFSCLEMARANVKGLREQIPVVLWEEINGLGTLLSGTAKEADFSYTRVIELCREVNRMHMLILGMVSETMARGERYHLWQMGTYIERADKTSRMLHVKYFHLLPDLSHVGTIVDDVRWGALLLSLDARADYNREYGLITPAKVIDAIVRSPLFARSITFCLRQFSRSLETMPEASRENPQLLLNALCSKIENFPAPEIIAFGVHEFINDLQIDMNRVNDAVVESVFSPGLHGEAVKFVKEMSQ